MNDIHSGTTEYTGGQLADEGLRRVPGAAFVTGTDPMVDGGVVATIRSA